MRYESMKERKERFKQLGIEQYNKNKEKKIISDDYFNHPSNIRKINRELMNETNFPHDKIEFADNNS